MHLTARAGRLLLLAVLFPACSGGNGTTSPSPPAPAPASVPPSAQPGAINGQVYNLEINLGPGVTQSPAQVGTFVTGTVMNYAFVGVDPLATIRVLLDKSTVPTAGRVTMDRAHRFDSAVTREPGQHAPAFSGLTSDGRTISLSDYRGKYVFVDFSEGNCPGSVNEAPYLQAHLNAWKARGMEILTVLVYNTGGAPATAGDLRAWQSAYGLSFPVILDTGHATEIYNSDAILSHTDFPSGYVVDPTGVIRYRFSGFEGPVIDAAIATLFP